MKECNWFEKLIDAIFGLGKCQKPMALPATSTIPQLKVNYFDVRPGLVRLGEPVRVIWETVGADLIRIDPLGRVKQPKGQRVHTPVKDTDYVLTVSNQGGTKTRTKHVEVLALPA